MQVLRGLIEMLAAIELDDDTGFETNETTDIDADRMLPPELIAIQLSSTQAIPKTSLCFRLVLA